MWWAALPLPHPPGSALPPEALQPLATWALQFTPRVALLEEAVAMEVQASLRLFGGWPALRERVARDSTELGVPQVGWATSSLAALALARAGRQGRREQAVAPQLDPLPLLTLSACAPHHETLHRLGCRTLGALRQLPRGGVSRRFGAGLLHALDQAYGLRPEAHDWVPLPERFEARLELPGRVEAAPALLFGARRLMLSLCGWLAARHQGVSAFTLRWHHDSLRARAVPPEGQLSLRTAEPTRDLEHLCRLLAEHLARVTLAAPVDALALHADETQPLTPVSGSLLPETQAPAEALWQTLERLAARLGPERVLRPQLADDHRPEWMQHWQSAVQPLPRQSAPASELPQPSWLLPEPLPLALRGERPMYQGVLLLLAGPHRVEGGWWHRQGEGPEAAPLHVQRDYWVALSAQAGVLWVFQQRLAGEQTGWFLHGVFA